MSNHRVCAHCGKAGWSTWMVEHTDPETKKVTILHAWCVKPFEASKA